MLIHCPRCGNDLPESEFGICRARPSGKNLYCRTCIGRSIKAARARNIARGLRGDGKKRKTREKKVKAKPVKPIVDGSIDAGLEVLSKIVPYGIALSQQDLAHVCGCSHGRISQIEIKALNKLRTRIQSDESLRSKLAAFI